VVQNIGHKVKYLIYFILYLIATAIIAFIIFASTLPDDGKCHCVERPALVHYILATIITAVPVFASMIVMDRSSKIKK
jgi:hypothetical protein